MLVGILKNYIFILIVGLILLFVNFRYMFYGLIYIDEFKKIRKKLFLKFLYLLLILIDEVYFLYIGFKFFERFNRIKIMFWINFLVYFIWIFGCIMGGILYNFINFDLKGIDFIIIEFFCIVVIF